MAISIDMSIISNDEIIIHDQRVSKEKIINHLINNFGFINREDIESAFCEACRKAQIYDKHINSIDAIIIKIARATIIDEQRKVSHEIIGWDDTTTSQLPSDDISIEAQIINAEAAKILVKALMRLPQLLGC